MNEQKAPNGIEWTRIKNPDGTIRRGWTWNPTGGCFHGCTWKMPDGQIAECYAKTVAERLSKAAYYDGFVSHYWRPETLHEPFSMKDPSGIFVGSMADLFGNWVPEWQLKEVMGVMKGAHWHIFQTLSKYPLRLKEFEFPDNVWAGVSLPAGHEMSQTGGARALLVYLKHMEQINAATRFMSIEPQWFDVAPIFERWLDAGKEKLPFEWAIIGAASNGAKTYQPEPEWIRNLLRILDKQNIPVFFKGNMRGSQGKAFTTWREDFPTVAYAPPIENVPLKVMESYQQLPLF